MFAVGSNSDGIRSSGIKLPSPAKIPNIHYHVKKNIQGFFNAVFQDEALRLTGTEAGKGTLKQMKLLTEHSFSVPCFI